MCKHSLSIRRWALQAVDGTADANWAWSWRLRPRLPHLLGPPHLLTPNLPNPLPWSARLWMAEYTIGTGRWRVGNLVLGNSGGSRGHFG